MSAPDPVFVSDVIGEGAEAHRIVRVASWEFRAPENDPQREALVEDTELARHLGVRRDHLRELIRVYRDSLDIQPVTILPATPVKSRGRPGEGFRLTRADALFIVTRSSAPRAKAITKEMIDVFLRVMEGLLVPADHLPREEADELRRELAEVRADGLAGIIGDDRAVEVTRLLGELARIRAAGGDTRGPRRRAENELRNVVGFVGPGSDWGSLPRATLHNALRTLRYWIRKAQKDARKARRDQRPVVLRISVQLSIPFGRTGGEG